jgi:hypothetical protein
VTVLVILLLLLVPIGIISLLLWPKKKLGQSWSYTPMPEETQRRIGELRRAGRYKEAQRIYDRDEKARACPWKGRIVERE